MIIIFDTHAGLCNQFYDINLGINFCLINNIPFSFRYCSFRNKDLVSWYNVDFKSLFDTSFLKKFEGLYIDIDTLYLTKDNTYNFDGILCDYLFTHNDLEKIKLIPKDYVILKNFFAIYDFSKLIYNVNSQILPSQRLTDLYNTVKNSLLQDKEEYNFIHYRYEKDFTDFFNIHNTENLIDLIVRINSKFKNPYLKIYIATSNIRSIINLESSGLSHIIITKNEDKLQNYNFEELAFVDYMFGLNSNEVFGHNKSSFSGMLNHLKGTHNYYNE
jgi:hypothetical protein